MRRVILVLSSVVAGFALLLVLALVALHYWFNPNMLITPLSAQLQQKTGLVLRIDGQLRWHIFPRTGIVVEQLSLQPTTVNPQATNIKLNALRVDLRLWPLITQRKVIINEIDLDGLDLTLAQKTLKKTATLPPATIPAVLTTVMHQNTSSNKNIHFDIKNIRVTNTTLHGVLEQSMPGAIVYIDNFAAKNLNWENPSKTVPIDLAARIDHQGISDTLSLHSEFNLDKVKQTLKVTHLQASINTLQIQGDLNATQINTAPQYQGQFTLDDSNLANTLHLLLNKDFPALKTLHSKFALTGNLQKIDLSALTLKLNAQSIVGALQYDIKQKHITSAFNAGTLYWPDANAPKEQDSEQQASTLAKPILLSAAPSASNTSGQFSLDSQIQIQHFIYNTLSLDNIRTQLHYDGHTVTLNPFVVTVLQGLYQGKILWTPEGNKLQVGGTLSHLDLAALQHYLGQQPSLTGLLDTQGTLNSEGTDMLANLNGNLFVDIKQGTWTHLNMTNILSFLNATGSKRISASGDTFSSANGHFNIHNGIADNPDLQLISPLLSIKGKGLVDLRRNALNYNLMLRPNEIVLEQVRGLSQWLKKDIPITVTGSLNDPTIKVDQAALITTQVQDQLDDTVKRVRKLILIR